MDLAPVLLFVYKRLECLQTTVESLKQNILSADTKLYVFSDGAKTDADRDKVNAVRRYVNEIKGFKSVTKFESDVNKGLAKSITSGVTEVLRTEGRVIVLEDDLETSPNFLAYMNKALDYYESFPQVFSISGFSFPIQTPDTYHFDTYYLNRAGSWGWATWKNRWQSIDWDLLKQNGSVDLSNTREMGTDFPTLVKKYKEGSIDSWAVPWSYYGFVKNFRTVYPAVSKVRNIGFDKDATHTANFQNRFQTIVDPGINTDFKFPAFVTDTPYFTREFLKRFSYYERLKWKVLSTLSRL